MRRVILFDLDGTLLDTLADLRSAVNHVLALRGLEPLPMDAVRRYVGNGAVRLLQLALPDGMYDEAALRDFKTYYDAHSKDETAPYPGIPEVLRELKDLGCRVAVLSNKPDWAVGGLCRSYFGDLAELAVGEKPDCPKKPAPDMVFHAVRQMGASLSDAVYVGDSEVDVQTARNAGIPCVSVTWGFRDEETIRAAGGDCFCRTAAELMERLKEISHGE